jgi:hypothetical protein
LRKKNGKMGKRIVVLFLAVAVTRAAQMTNDNRLEGVDNEQFGGTRYRHRDGRRRLFVDDALRTRHTDGTESLERSSHVGSTFDTSFMPLMQSPCRPEPDGYFGGTYGTPVEVQYAIKVEATPLAPIQGIVEAIEEKVADEVLANAFPAICGFKDHERLIQANGIKFDKIEGLSKGKIDNMPTFSWTLFLLRANGALPFCFLPFMFTIVSKKRAVPTQTNSTIVEYIWPVSMFTGNRAAKPQLGYSQL